MLYRVQNGMLISGRIIFVLAASWMLVSCAGSETYEGVLGEGNIAALSEEQLLIQEKTSVIKLDMAGGMGRALALRYKAGQGVKLIGRSTTDEYGDVHETVRMIEFEDGERLYIR